MPARTFQFRTGPTLSHTVTLADGYTQPASDTSGTAKVVRGGTLVFRVNKADGSGTTKDIGGVTLHSNYATAPAHYFQGSYISQASGSIPGSDNGYWTSAFFGSGGGTAVSPPAPQPIIVPGQPAGDSNTIEFVGMWSSNFTFGIQPDNESEYGADAWDGYDFTIAGSGRSVTVDGGNFSVRSPGATFETWIQSLSGTALTDMTAILQTGNAFTLTITAQSS